METQSSSRAPGLPSTFRQTRLERELRSPEYYLQCLVSCMQVSMFVFFIVLHEYIQLQFVATFLSHSCFQSLRTKMSLLSRLAIRHIYTLFSRPALISRVPSISLAFSA